MMAQNKDAADRAPSEIEELLPFHAAGALNARDARRVEEAMARDPDLARQYAEIQQEFAETIALNESLGAPSARAMQKLFEAIDAEPARTPAASFNPLARIADFFASLSPRTLAYSAVIGALALLLQAGVIGTLVTDRSGSYQTASSDGETGAGAVALVRFAPDAKLGDITRFLDSYHASIVSGPKAGMFRVRFGDKALSKEDTDRLLARVQGEKIVSQVLPAD